MGHIAHGGALVPISLAMAYVIVVYRAMDVRLVIRQGLRYLLATGGIRAAQVIISIAIIVIATNVSGDRAPGVTWRIVPICTGFALIALIGAFAGRAQRWLDRRFFREAYNTEQILSDLANQVRRIVDTGSVLRTVAHRISESLHVPRVALLLNNGGTFELAYAVGYPSPPGVQISADSLTVQHLKNNQELTVHLDGPDSWIHDLQEAERDSIARLKPELMLPLSLNEKLVGIMSLGPKQSEEPFTRTDIQLLDSVATQTGLALENSRLTAEIAAELAERERINRELEIAREVQQRLFPQTTPSIPGIEIAGYCRPALGVGGDYYDYFAVADGDLGIAIGDVSGKGFPAALLMAGLRASLRAQTIRGEPDLAAMMRHINTLAYEGSAVNKYATFFYGQYSPQSRLLSYVNAGHEPPLIFRRDSVVRLDTGGPVVGLVPCVQYEQGSVMLEPGDILVALTDGISEAMNPSDEEWGVENLISCVRNCDGLASGELIERVMASADAFAAGAKQHDDMTMIVARILYS
jgi:sigma-B regulation protein RsbU (phosphoserine phosphatase)